MHEDIRPSIVIAALDLLQRTHGRSRIQISGYSMMPLLRPGDAVVVAHTQVVRVGDIIVRRSDAGLIVHRVIRISQADEGQVHILTKGDATLTVDPPATPEDIIGRVIALERGRYIALDSGVWRRLGWLMAKYSCFLTWLYQIALRLRQRLPRPLKRGGGVVLRSLHFPFQLVAWASQGRLCR